MTPVTGPMRHPRWARQAFVSLFGVGAVGRGGRRDRATAIQGRTQPPVLSILSGKRFTAYPASLRYRAHRSTRPALCLHAIPSHAKPAEVHAHGTASRRACRRARLASRRRPTTSHTGSVGTQARSQIRLLSPRRRNTTRLTVSTAACRKWVRRSPDDIDSSRSRANGLGNQARDRRCVNPSRY